MYNFIVAQSFGSEFLTVVVLYLIAAFIGFIISVYIVRAIFDIPKIVRLHKAQVRLLEEIAKNQGVDDTKVQSIVSESFGWESTKAQNTNMI